MKAKLTNHSKQRIRERCDNISHKRIQTIFKTSNIKPVKKITVTRSLYYTKTNNQGVKALINKDGVIVTVLPLRLDYDFHVKYENYSITIFPDCFMETNNPILLTEFKKLNPVTLDYEDIPKRKTNNFQEVFAYAWNLYLEKQNEKTKKNPSKYLQEQMAR